MIMIVHVPGDFYVPRGFTGDTRTIVPDSVVMWMANEYDLTHNGLLGLDPACGAYTIPRVLRTLGATQVDACDIDANNFKISSEEAASLTARGLGVGITKLGDMTQLFFDDKYDYIYTSLPFNWFGDDPLSPHYAMTLRHLIADTGMLLIDSAIHVIREDKKVPVASRQIKYFEALGFTLEKQINFTIDGQNSNFDNSYSELVFRLSADQPQTYI
ncbi:MAG: hypothetical protein JWM81_411 [Candidatus Saccharibacteria bacterium]|nr:hypothetical protein [Candidatus Saccharibacteria bacterium]